MTQNDRLSSLMARFELDVLPSNGQSDHLFVISDALSGLLLRVVLSPKGINNLKLIAHETVTFSAEVDWGGDNNPLFSSLPDIIEIDLTTDVEAASLALLLKSENDAQRCGVGSVLSRLGEVLIVRLMRLQIERGDARIGLFGGLSDARLSRAIVAIHEEPGRHWRNEDLATIAGLSLSRFAELFQSTVGETPFGYLRKWRLVLARQDIARGVRVQETARRYGYSSGEALSRAFNKQFGESPLRVRKQFAE